MASPPKALAKQLLDSYERVGGINNIDNANLPSKSAIKDICCQLLELLFPGYYCNEIIRSSSAEAITTNKIVHLHQVLSLEITKSLEFSPPEGELLGDYNQKAKDLTCNFLQKLPELRQISSTDVEAAFDGDPAASCYEEIILAYPCIEAISIQRMAHVLDQLGITLIPRMMTEWAHSRTGIDIHPGAKIGSYFFIDHGTGVVIGETCVIGHHVKIYHGVTLGARSTSGGQRLRGLRRHPTIEDYVTIYPGATILGGETVIGSHSTVGGNVFILNSVPAHSLVTYEKGSVVVQDKTSMKPANA
ncbi:MAG: serine O-acetyltransferase [Verrucomicrobiota bacterium]